MILMDCWGGGWHQRCPKSAALYQRILSFIQAHQITLHTVIDACYPVDGAFEPDPVLDYIRCHHRRRDVLNWERFRDQGFNQGAWILAGQSWNVCIHQRPLGVMRYVTDTHMRCQLYTHPDILDRAPGQDRALGDKDFARDGRAEWEPRPQGFWRVRHPRYRPEPWL